MRRLLLWFRAHRIVTWTLRVILILWAIQLWMNWAAERAWRQYCDETRKRGVKLTLAEFAPPEIPDEENFAMLPMFKTAFAAPSGATPPNPFALPNSSSGSLPSGGDRIKGKPVDWIAWQQHFKTAGWIAETTSDPVADLLRALDHCQPAIDEWREWKQRPQCRFPVDWKADPITLRLPMLGTLQGATAFFGWQMRAHLAQNNSVAAIEDFQNAFQAYRSLRNHPTLIAGLTRLAMLAVVNTRIGDGLAAHAWSESDLNTLAAELATVRLWDDYRMGISSERPFLNAVHDKFAMSNRWERATEWNKIYSRSTDVRNMLMGLSFSKHGIRDNQLRANRYLDELLARVTDHGVDFNRSPALEPDASDNILRQLHYALFNLCVPPYQGTEQRYVRAQTQLAQTQIAIALERYHLAREAFPETLDALIPKYLVGSLLDPWNGMPMKYSRNKTDSFLLYSVGKDHKDDGGVVDPQRIESSQRDAIWLYAPP